jgi:diguanylate cyclase (GGDEF)-like protein
MGSPHPRMLLGTRTPSILKEARAVLEPAGWEVHAAADAAALRSAVEEDPPTLVVVGLEGLAADAIALCRDLVRGGSGAPVSVVVATEDPTGEVIDLAVEAGAAEVVGRPVRWALFLHRVRMMLERLEGLAEAGQRRESIENLHRIARLGSWTFEPDSGRMQWSGQMHALLGLERGVPTDFEAFSLCIHPDDRDLVTAAVERSRRERCAVDVLFRVVVPSGSVRHVQLRGEIVEIEPFRMHGTIQDVTEQSRAQEKIRFLAHFDSLTGLANRRRFMEQLERARSRCEGDAQKMALLYMDLDQFKRINDTLGHSAGDELLRKVADVLFEKVRSTDLVGRPSSTDESEISRLGGDEFAVMLTRIETREDAKRVASRILASLQKPIVVEGHEITATVSIGIAVYPDDGEDVETLVKHADRALYHAKERGRNGFQFFSEELNAGAMKRLTIESRLRTAVEGEGLHLFYQPRLDLRTGALDGVEALLRWEDPELGTVTPREFIPLAEETGLIVALGHWVMGAACAQGQAWREAGLGDVRMSVNVSTIQFRRGDLIQTVGEALASTGFDPKLLELEITESLMLQDDEATAMLLRELRAMGIRVALDDFGTGYSSLSYLARYPLDVLKIDRSLVRDLVGDPHAQGIATAVISMAHVLGLRVVAEGVDQKEQLTFLRRQGCDEAQGFLIAGPLAPEKVLDSLTSPALRKPC